MEKILLIDVPEVETVQQIARQLHLRTLIIPPEQYTQPISAIAGFSNYASCIASLPRAEVIPQDRILVLCGLKNSVTNRLLAMLRQTSRQDLYKAVLTPTNAAWNTLELAYALQQERQSIE